MTCDICAKKKATVHLTEIVDEQMSEMHLCEECARQKSAQMEQQFGLADLLAGLSDFTKTPSATSKEAEKTALKCASCGLLYEDFRKFGRLGCGECYMSFKEHLSGLLRKIHGSHKHLGKSPASAQSAPASGAGTVVATISPAQALEDLKKQLYMAIHAEDFEKAVLLRDKIRALEQS